MRRTAAETREHVLGVARELFYWHGIRAIGIDRVAVEAEVAPTTLYRIFAGKDDLVAAYVDDEHARSGVWFAKALEEAGPDPRDRILAVFEGLLEQLTPDKFRGCACMMTLAEFPDPELAAHRRAVASKAWVRTRVGELTDQLAAAYPVADPAALADQLTLILEGANASAQALGVNGPAKQARALAAAAISAAT